MPARVKTKAPLNATLIRALTYIFYLMSVEDCYLICLLKEIILEYNYRLSLSVVDESVYIDPLMINVIYHMFPIYLYCASLIVLGSS